MIWGTPSEPWIIFDKDVATWAPFDGFYKNEHELYQLRAMMLKQIHSSWWFGEFSRLLKVTLSLKSMV